MAAARRGWRTAGTLDTTRRIARLADYDLWQRQDWRCEVAAGKIYFWGPASPDVTGPGLEAISTAVV